MWSQEPCVFIPNACSSPRSEYCASLPAGRARPGALTFGPRGLPAHGPAAARRPAGCSQPMAAQDTNAPACVRSSDWLSRFARARLCRGAVRGAVRERPPCYGSCGVAGAPTSIASCPGSPSTSAASAGAARGKVPGASPDPAASPREGLGRRRSSLGFVTQKCFSIGCLLAGMKFLVRYFKMVFNVEDR